MADFSERHFQRLEQEAQREFRRRSLALTRRFPSWIGPETRRRRWLKRAAVAGIVLGVLVAPFGVLVGGAVWLYRQGFPTWLALLSSVAAVGALLAWIATRISRRLTGRPRWRFIGKWVALPVTAAYSLHALFVFSATHAKTEETRREFASLHPLLRVAVSTATVFDRGMVVTDGARVPGDYAQMGLPVYERSLHFRQPDGWVHAVDLRTIGRPWWRNFLTRWYFEIMGFRTVRHVGTADHLHVSFPSRVRPDAS